MQDNIQHITTLLQTKSCAKQVVYKNLRKAFKALREEAEKLIEQVNERTENLEDEITFSVEQVNEYEFHLKVAGDLLVFFLHTNVIKLSDDYSYNRSPYVAEKPDRQYLGQINVYNFMADSIKYNRLRDPGYLVARLMVNLENHFIVEGDGQIKFMFESVSSKKLESSDISIIMQLLVLEALNHDLIAPPFQKIRGITLEQKMAKTEVMGSGNKIGFQMSYKES